jgi:hypothetical protein
VHSDVAVVIGTAGGLLLIGAGLALLVGLMSKRFEHGLPSRGLCVYPSRGEIRFGQ